MTWPTHKLRLLFRDLAAGAAFGAMAISGALPTWVIAIFAVGLGAALLGLRLLGDRTLLSVFLLAGSASLLYASAAAGKLDLVVAACTFAAIITLSRIHATPAPTTDGQVHLTSLLMTAGGAALSGEMLFALFLCAFGLLAALSLGTQTLESKGSADRAALAPATRQLLLGGLLAIAGSAVFFASFPRLSWNLAARRGNRLEGALMGFAEPVRPRGRGRIKNNPRLVARIQISPDPGVSSLNAYWIGRAFSEFNGHEWSSPAEIFQSSPRVVVRPDAKRLLHQTIELLPTYGSSALIAMERPAMFGNARAHLESGPTVQTWLRDFGEGHVRFVESGLGYRYEAYSTPPLDGRPDDEALDANIDPESYLQVPAGLDPRVPALAAQVIGSEKDPLRSARKVEDHLKRAYRYSLDLSDAPDPLADFLFTTKSGHCEDFATALAILLRTQGIPTRVVIGFFGGERVGDQYVLRAGDAHSWTQVLVAGRGFVSVDATPEAHRAAEPSLALGWLTPLYEFLDMRWRAWVVDYSLKDQAMIARSVVEPVSRFHLKWPNLNWKWLGAGVCLIALIISGIRVRGRRRRTLTHPASALLKRLERALRKAGLLLDQEDLETTTHRLLALQHPMAKEVAPIARRYLEARFGGRAFREREASDLARSLEGACNKYRGAHRNDISIVQVP
jgi:protein-glutamine gamma-glutamyltransferase